VECIGVLLRWGDGGLGLGVVYAVSLGEFKGNNFKES
jgi:hypothetical protein